MSQKEIVKFCKELGCCDACCFRYLGLKKPQLYENSKESILQYLDHTTNSEVSENPAEVDKTEETALTPIATLQTSPESEDKSESSLKPSENTEGTHEQPENGKTTEETPQKDQEMADESTRTAEDGDSSTNGMGSPPAKRQKTDVCVSCLGVLQESSWEECFEMVKEQLEKKRYECNTFACALSAPIATLIREKVIILKLMEKFPQYDAKSLTPLKEAWKWSFGAAAAVRVRKALDSGAVSPLLATVTLEYPDELQELEILKTLAPSLFATRKQQKRRFAVEFTRRCAEQALDGATLLTFKEAGWGDVPTAGTRVKCVSVMCSHAPVYLGGRYVKLSRSLPQTPWLVNGRRMMESSVQEIIFQHIATHYQLSAEACEARLKFMAAGREDVDVRCLGDGRPFAVEIADPRRELTSEELSNICEEIAKSGQVVVKRLTHVTREDLALLKKGEESKTKTYNALCIKLTHSKHDEQTDGPPTVTERDIANINSYSNTSDDQSRVSILQRTPIRVLHRRPLLVRPRRIHSLAAQPVPGHPALFTLRIRTEAGTYVKEWCHGELRRTRPSLRHALQAASDILALDVASVDLDWPPTH